MPVTTRDQAETEPELVKALATVVRAADKEFQRVGGGTRHWVRDCFLPLLNRNGFIVTPDPEFVAQGVAIVKAAIAKAEGR